MFDSVRDDMRTTLDEIKAAGLHKPERVIGTPSPRPSPSRRVAAPVRCSTSAPTTTWASPTTPT